jgi:type IV pilus assembly protein PilW
MTSRTPWSRVPAGASRQRQRQRGVSVMEIMVGITVGLVLLAGMALMFANSSRSAAELDRSARHIENGRLAVDLLVDELQLAAYYGTVPVTANPAAAADLPVCATMAALATALRSQQTASPPTVPSGVRGLTPAEAATLAAASPACMPNYVAGTPAVVVRRLDTVAVLPGAATDGVLYMQSSHYPGDTTTGYVASTAKSDFTLHSIAAAGASGPTSANLNPVRRFLSRIYYLASCNLCSPSDGIPTLVRSEITSTGYQVSPLAEGIERVGFDYGLDTSGDGAVDEWYGLNGTSAATESAYMATKGWGNVVAVRLAVVSRAAEASPGWNDSGHRYPVGLQGSGAATSFAPTGAAQLPFKRRGYSSTVRLQGVAGPRETP